MIPRFPRGFTNPVLIGGGGFAMVYRLRQEALGRAVAIKIITRQSSENRLALLSEARTQASVKLPCVPQVYDAFEFDKQIYIVMQWVRGCSLRTVLEKNLDSHQRLALAAALIDAVANLHRQNFAHRDIKPENILITANDGLFLIDFGLTKSIIDGSKTMANVVKGTPAFMAPELWQFGGNMDPIRSDVYSLGKVLKFVLDEESTHPLLQACLVDRPQKRLATALEVQTLFEKTGGTLNQPAVDWGRIVEPELSVQVSQQLLSGARKLIARQRLDEGYQLVVDAVQENPELAEALQLMEKFPRIKQRLHNRRIAAMVAAGVVLVLLVAGAYWAGWQRAHRLGGSLTRGQLETAHRQSLSLGAQQRERLGGVVDARFRQDSLALHHYQGTMVLHAVPPSGQVVLDNAPLPLDGEQSAMVEVRVGLHTVQWVDSSGVMRWREQVDLLPFQNKALAIRVR
jgi:predicted Ser/Thr protein kinase